jgi:undecaprenyl-diphosphatase
MGLLESLILGVLQGITEFLPVSSSGHLVVMRAFMDIGGEFTLFDILLHVSTLVVVIIIFRDRIRRILVSLWRLVTGKRGDEDRVNLRLVLIILVATVVTASIGFAIEDLNVDQYPKIVSILFIVSGLILFLSRFFKGEKGYREIGLKEGLITGLAQGLGVLPGISRSGITISAALGAGMKREIGGEFSFLISIPAILGALILKLKDFDELLTVVKPSVLLIGVAASFIAGMFSLILLLRIVKSGKLYLFSFYLIPLGIIGMFLL